MAGLPENAGVPGPESFGNLRPLGFLRAPTVDETKRALAIRRVVKDADLDPVLLFFLADANAAAERARLSNAVREAVDAGVHRIETAIPTNAEWAKAVSWAAWFAKAMQTGAKAVLVTGGVVGIMLLAVAIQGWRVGYGAGWDAQQSVRWKTWNQSACESLANVRHELRTRGADVQALDRERTRRGC